MPAKPNSTPSAKPVAYLTVQTSASPRADVYLAEQLPTISRSQWKKRLLAGLVLRGQVPLLVKSELKLGDVLTILALPPTKPDTYDDIALVYEDHQLLAINKPVGILTHAKGAMLHEATIETYLEQFVGSEVPRHGIVHRLDRATSGVLLAGRTIEAIQSLQQQFAARHVQKYYVAVVQGRLEHPKARLDWPIARNPKSPHTFRVDVKGKTAQTDMFVIASSDDQSVVVLKPKTGRTHQLRVHMAHLGHPIIGDTVYGQAKDRNQRLMLHAYRIDVAHPTTAKDLSFSAPLPEHVLWSQYGADISKFVDQDAA